MRINLHKFSTVGPIHSLFGLGEEMRRLTPYFKYQRGKYRKVESCQRYSDGYGDSYQQGYNEGYEVGYKQGYEEGKRETKVKM